MPRSILRVDTLLELYEPQAGMYETFLNTPFLAFASETYTSMPTALRYCRAI